MEQILIAEALNRLLPESAIEKLSRISFVTAKTKSEVLNELIDKKYNYCRGRFKMKSRAEINKWLWCSCYIKRKQKKALQEMWKNNKEAIQQMFVENKNRF